MKRVLFFAPFGHWAVHHQLDAVLAAALRTRGCEVAVAGCDGIFSTCDLLAWTGSEAANVCRHCAAQSKSLFGTFNLPLRQLRDFLTPNDVERARQWSLGLDVTSYASATFEGKPIGEWATSSVFSHFRITSASLHLPHVRQVHQGYLVTALLTWIALSRMLDDFRADAMVVFNGRMAPYRVAFEVAKERGVRVLGHERGMTPGTFTLYENTSCRETEPIFDWIERWRQVPLSSAECDRCRQLTSRQTGTNLNFPGFYDYQTETAEVRHKLDIPPAARILGVFTSSEFELANNSSYKSITGQLEYIDRLIEVFRGRPDYLVVRHHPNIAGDATLAADHDFLRRAWRQAQSAPANVRIILPSEKLSTYGLIPHLSGAIVFFSSTVVESIAHGVAAAAMPESYAHQAATFLIDDTSHEGFARLVDQLFARTAAFQPSDLRSCYRYLSASLARHSSKLDAVGIKNFFEADIRVRHTDDLLPRRDATLDRVCDFLVSGAPIFDMPGDADLRRGTAEEDAFFESEWNRIKGNNWRQAPPGAASPRDAESIPVAVVDVGCSTGNPSWRARSRHRALVERGRIETSGLSWDRILDAVKAKLGGMAERYVLLAGEGFEYDESFLQWAVKELEAEEHLSGITIGAWAARADGRIEGEIFTQRKPTGDFHEACSVLPSLHQPHVILSLGLFRTARLAGMLNAMPLAMTREEAAAHVFQWLRGENFQRRQAPFAMIRRIDPGTVAATGGGIDTPVLLLIFNRPDLTQQAFEAIRAQRPRKLFVAADGPRPDVPGERALCEAARRRVLDRIDWDCEVKTLLREENLGCKRAVSSAITWFFDQVEEGIVLEDDCLPEPDFFRFCAGALEHYRDTPAVMLIGGNNFQSGRWRGDGSLYFSKYPHIWGWAGWRRAWRHYDVAMAGLEEFLASDAWKALCPDPVEAAYWEDALRKTKAGEINTWDYQLTYMIWKHGGMSALPQVNLVSNLGFRGDATHTTEERSHAAGMETRELGAITFPEVIAVDAEADAFTFNAHFAPAGKPKARTKARKPQTSDKQRARVERLSGELSAIKESLAWKLTGRPVFSIEKRLRRLLGSKRDGDHLPAGKGEPPRTN